MSETLIQVRAPHFTAGAVLVADRCTEAAPIIKYAVGKTAEYLRRYFSAKGWRAVVVVRPAS